METVIKVIDITFIIGIRFVYSTNVGCRVLDIPNHFFVSLKIFVCSIKCFECFDKYGEYGATLYCVFFVFNYYVFCMSYRWNLESDKYNYITYTIMRMTIKVHFIIIYTKS